MNTEIRDSELYLLEELIGDLDVKIAEHEKKFNAIDPENRTEYYQAHGELITLFNMQILLVQKKREVRQRYKNEQNKMYYHLGK